MLDTDECYGQKKRREGGRKEGRLKRVKRKWGQGDAK